METHESPNPKAQDPGQLLVPVPLWVPEKTKAPTQAFRQTVSSPFLHLFVLSRSSTGSMMPTRPGEDSLLYSVYQFTCSSLPETPSQQHSEVMLATSLGILRPSQVQH